MPEREPLVSVVIPSLNQGRFIVETLESIFAQTYKNVEILVMDGGSTDETHVILSKYSDLITVHSAPDEGIFDALNQGFALTRGALVAWINSDDVYFTRDVFRKVCTCFSEHPNVDMLYGDVAIISSDSKLLRLRLVPPFSGYRLKRMNTIPQPGVFFRRRVIENEKLRNYISLDYEFWLRLDREGYVIRHIHSILAGDRQYPERLSVRKRGQIAAEIATYRPTQLPLWKLRSLLFLDRSLQALYRLNGLLSLIRYLFFKRSGENLAFPAVFDSAGITFYRQIFRSITSVR